MYLIVSLPNSYVKLQMKLTDQLQQITPTDTISHQRALYATLQHKLQESCNTLYIYNTYINTNFVDFSKEN